MSGDTPKPVSLDDLVVYALNAHDLGEDADIAAHLRASPESARREQELRAAAGELAAAVVDEVAPGPGLRSRVLAEARRRRPPAPVVAGASPIDVHRVELARALLLLGDLTAEDWERSLDRPEFAGWTVQDVAVHLVANASLLADRLGAPVPGITETAVDNEGRTAQARARHAGRPPAAAVAELEAAAEAADAAVLGRGEARLDERIDWRGVAMPTAAALLERTFETWTHADDIRRVIGAPMLPPPPASLVTMTHAACGLVPLMLAVRGVGHPDRLVRFRFTDLDGTGWDVDLGGATGVRPAGDDPVDAEIVTDAVAFCRRVSARLPAGEVCSRVDGDQRLARDIVDALPALASL